MTSRERRDELRAAYDERPRDAGVYSIRNTATGKVFVASTVDLASVRNRLEFGQTTDSTGVLDRALVADAREHGMKSFEFEVLDVLERDPNSDEREIADDLKALELLWREKLADRRLY